MDGGRGVPGAIADPWSEVWRLYDTDLDLSLAAIAARTGIGSGRIWHAAWDRHRDDPTRLNPKQRRRHRTLARLRARLEADPTNAAALFRARGLGFKVALRKTGRPRLPDAVVAPIIVAHEAGALLKDIAAAQGLPLSALAARVAKLQGRGVLAKRRSSALSRSVPQSSGAGYSKQMEHP